MSCIPLATESKAFWVSDNLDRVRAQDRRLSRKRSHVSLDRLRRSMSLETCKVDSPSKNPIDVVLERQSNSLKCRYNPPETIPEEEFERIRRESLIPRVGLLAGVGRRKSSVVPEAVSIAASSAATSFMSVVASVTALPKTATTAAVVNGNSSSVMCADEIVTMATDSVQLEGGSDGSNYSQRRDEGLGESFDRYSELSDSTSRIGIVGSVIELQTLHPTAHGSPGRYPNASSGGMAASPEINRRNGGSMCGIDDDDFDGMTFTAKPMSEEERGDPNEIDPLSFLTEAQAKRVTFM